MAYAVCVTFTLAPGQLEPFLELVQKQAENSINLEVGCHQFDVCSDPSNPDTVFLYEIYENKAAFELHLKTQHFLDFDAAVADMVSDKKVEIWATIYQPKTALD